MVRRCGCEAAAEHDRSLRSALFRSAVPLGVTPAMMLTVAAVHLCLLAAAGASAPPEPVPVTGFVDFSAATGPAAASLRSTDMYSYGLNLYSAFAEDTSGSPAYQSCVEQTMGVDGVGLLRYHRSQQMQDSAQSSVGWIQDAGTAGKCRWNETRVSRVVSQVPWLRNATSARRVMMGINGWPACMADPGNNGALLPGAHAQFASLCASLVTLVNGKLGLGVRIFEVTNELDGNKAYAGNMSAVGRIVATAASAMRAAQDDLHRAGLASDTGSDLLVGGPAFARPDLTDGVRAYVSTAGASTDFVSYHSYSTGDSGKANSSIWDDAQWAGETTDGVRAAVVEGCTNASETTGVCAEAGNGGAGMRLWHDENQHQLEPTRRAHDQRGRGRVRRPGDALGPAQRCRRGPMERG